jgi:signal transduction histidine kinase/ActR/RegA family two-component response regulator
MSDSGRLPHSSPHGAESTTTSAHSSARGDSPPVSLTEDHRPQVRAAETRLLYENANTGVVITIVIAVLLAYAQWDAVTQAVVVAWLVYMLLVSIARFVLAQRYWRASSTEVTNSRWNAAFVVGTALAAAGWAAGTIALYRPHPPMNEIFVVFVIGGVMLGSASLLYARPEAFLTFLVPTGLVISWRLASEGDEEHLIMGFLGAVFTVATIITTWRFRLAIESSFTLRFANQNLIASLQKAKNDTDALNRELEFRVGDRTAKLLEADQRKDEFLATLAHELRNPLAPIRFALEALKGDAPSAAAGRARDVIERQVRQLVRLVDDLLDVSRITANKIQLRREPLDLARLMETAAESITPLATASGHTIDVQLPARAIWIDGDGARLVQVFANVLNNAVKFTPRDGNIWFTADRQSDVATVRIRDTGVGIAAEVLSSVFDMFHQAEPALDRPSGGLGIGLTLARRLVEMHGGEIEIRSPGVGAGTEVEIRLPTRTAPAATAMAGDLPPVAPTRPLRVLIVEDNVDAAEMLELAVTHLGHLTRVAHDGASAVTAATEFTPDVIFLDIGLPIMNGYDVAQALRAQPQFSHVHIAAVTGWGQDEDRRRAREAGCDSHFTKPLSPAALEELLGKIAAPELDDSRAGATPRTRHGDSGAGF